MAVYALVNLETMVVDNIEERNSVPPSLNNYRWIKDDQWAGGEQATVGRIWDGGLPARFADPVAIEPDPEGPTSEAEAIAAIDAGMTDLQAKIDQLKALRG